MDDDKRPGRRAPVAILALALMTALPMTPLVMRGTVWAMSTLGVVMAFDPFTAVVFSVFLLPRIIGSLWVYFKVDGMWGHEVAYMVAFLVMPILGIIIYLATAQKLRTPPQGFEYAEIRDGLVHQPIYQYVGFPGHPPGADQVPLGPAQAPPMDGPPQTPAPLPTDQYPRPPQPPAPPMDGGQPPLYSRPPVEVPAEPTPPPSGMTQGIRQPPPVRPYPGGAPPQAHPPAMPHPYQGQPPHPYPPTGYHQYGYPQPGYPIPQGSPPQPGYPQQPSPYYQYGQPINPAYVAQQPAYPSMPAPPPYAPYGVPYQASTPWVREPGPEWKKVGERLVQKRDYLAWHNVVLLIIGAMMLASYILALVVYPFIFSFDGIDDSVLDMASNATFVLFTLIIQDGILIWMVWHQVVRRRVVPLSEMGISKAQLSDTGTLARSSAIGVVVGLVLFGAALLIELGQISVGFVPPDDAVVVGPGVGDLGGYLTWLVSGCLIAPVSEEFFFRGYAFYAFNKRHGLLVGLFVSSIGFSAIHGSIYSLLPIFVAGLGLALAYHRTGSLVPPMVAHAVNNFLALTLLYVGFYG